TALGYRRHVAPRERAILLCVLAASIDAEVAALFADLTGGCDQAALDLVLGPVFGGDTAADVDVLHARGLVDRDAAAGGALVPGPAVQIRGCAAPTRAPTRRR